MQRRRLNFNSIIDLLFAGLVSLSLVAVLSCELILFSNKLKWYPVFFVILVVSVAAASFWALRNRPLNPAFKIKPIDIKIFFIYFILFFISRAIDLQNSPIWLDEYSQAIYAFKGNIRGSIAYFAAVEQQPPLDYYFSAFSNSIFGLSVFAVKFTPLFFSFFIHIVLYFSITALTNSRMAGFLSAIAMLLNPLVLYYSVEARPLSLALLACCFVLHYFFLYLKNHQRNTLFFLFLSEVVFVYTTGLQPEIFLIALFLSSTPLLFFKSSRRVFAKFFLVHFLVMLVFLPALYKIFTISNEINQFTPDLFGQFLAELKSVSFNDYLPIFLNGLEAVIPCTLLVSIALTRTSLNKSLRCENTYKPVLIGCAFLLIFPPLFTVIFKGMINWAFMSKYYILFLPIPFALLGLAHAQATNKLSKEAKQLFFVFALSAVAFLQSIDREDRNDLVALREFRPHWPRTYQNLAQLTGQNDRVYFFDFHGIGDWRPSVWVGKEMLVAKEERKKLTPFADYFPFHATSKLGTDLALGKYENYFLLIQTTRNDPFLLEYFKRQFVVSEQTDLGQTLIIKLKKESAPIFIKMLERLLLQFHSSEFISTPIETVLDYHISSNQLQKARLYLLHFRAMIASKDKTIEGSIIDKQSIINEKIARYRKKIDNDRKN